MVSGVLVSSFGYFCLRSFVLVYFDITSGLFHLVVYLVDDLVACLLCCFVHPTNTRKIQHHFKYFQ